MLPNNPALVACKAAPCTTPQITTDVSERRLVSRIVRARFIGGHRILYRRYFLGRTGKVWFEDQCPLDVPEILTVLVSLLKLIDADRL